MAPRLLRLPFGLLLTAALALPPAAANAQAAPRPANTLRELWRQISACLEPVALTRGSSLTVQFALKRNGQLLGSPRISYAKLPDDPATRRADLEAARNGLDRCLPLQITDALGGAIAGRPLSIRIEGDRPQSSALARRKPAAANPVGNYPRAKLTLGAGRDRSA